MNTRKQLAQTLRFGMATALGFGIAGISQASTVTDPFDHLPRMANEELAELRGGFEFAGMDFRFGINLRTFIDEVLTLETVVQLTNVNQVPKLPGLSVSSSGSNPTLQQTTMSSAAPTASGTADTSPAPSAAAQPAPATTAAPLNQIQQQAPANLNLSGLSDGAAGVLVEDVNGFVAALHDVTQQRVTSLLIGNTSSRDLRQEIEIEITIDNFRNFQNAARSSILSNFLNRR